MERSMSLPFQGLKSLRQVILGDARHFQIIYLSSFLIFGILSLGWELEINRYLIVIGSCVLTQLIGSKIIGASPNSWKSALITALGLSILLHTSSLWIASLAGVIAIASKFIIRIQGKHIFNPANFGIILSILITNQAWVSPGQWGSDVILIYFIGAAALMVLLKVGRIDTSLAFIGTLFVLEACRSILYLGWGWDVLFHSFSNGSLLLFTFFMITDPVTTPKNKKARIIWAAGIAILAFILSQWFYVYTAPIWALFIAAPFTAIFNQLMKGESFQWITTRK